MRESTKLAILANFLIVADIGLAALTPKRLSLSLLGFVLLCLAAAIGGDA